VKVDVVEVGLVVLGVDLALVSSLVVMVDVVDHQVPLVVSTDWFHFHPPVTDERRDADRHRVNCTQSAPRHLISVIHTMLSFRFHYVLLGLVLINSFLIV